ncbi:MAG TPA: hypothetical protein VG297_08545 [Bryobacteraceae bacterium]|jgi:hypothetical protein|nr:hypothetical protein [Bryobacteraceae bacterium]
MGNERDRTVEQNRKADEGDAMVAVFSSSNHDGEMESLAIKGVLDANEIPAVVVGPHVLPNLEFQVQVPQQFAAQATQVIEDARKGGRQAAQEAESQSEVR